MNVWWQSSGGVHAKRHLFDIKKTKDRTSRRKIDKKNEL